MINCGRIFHIGTNLLKSFGFTNDSMQKNQKTIWHAFAFGLSLFTAGSACRGIFDTNTPCLPRFFYV